MKRILQTALPPAILFGLVILTWHYAVIVFGIKAFLVPTPLNVLRAVIDGRGELLQAVGLTAGAALSGFASSLLIGTLIACVFFAVGHRSAKLLSVRDFLADSSHHRDRASDRGLVWCRISERCAGVVHHQLVPDHHERHNGATGD